MINLLWASLAALALVVLLVAFAAVSDSGFLEGLAFGAFMLAVVTWLMCGVMALIVLPSRAVGRTTCRNWATQAGYPTKFRIMNWSDTGTCLALADNGHWVPNTQIIINVPSK